MDFWKQAQQLLKQFDECWIHAKAGHLTQLERWGSVDLATEYISELFAFLNGDHPTHWYWRELQVIAANVRDIRNSKLEQKRKLADRIKMFGIIQLLSINPPNDHWRYEVINIAAECSCSELTALLENETIE